MNFFFRKGRWRSILLKVILPVILLIILVTVALNWWVVSSTKDSVYSSVEKIPAHDVALVLGTSKYSRSGKSNLFFKSRIEAAVKLYKSGKIRHFLLSGDNSKTYYNEPQDMRKALMLQGVPDSVITLDYAGFRTFDSVVRSIKVFKQKKLVIITQEFHSYRALFISRYYDLDAIAFATEPVPQAYSFATRVREYLARCKAVLDLYILDKEPRFLGEEIDITI